MQPVIASTRDTSSSAEPMPNARVVQAAMCLIAVLIGALYWDVIKVLASDWWAESSHGLLVPPLVAYIVYVRRSQIASIPKEADPWGLAIVALGCMLLLLGHVASEFFISRVSLPVLLGGIVWTFWGKTRFRSLLLPLLLLLTMIPVPLLIYNSAALPLQLLASYVATYLAQLAGVAVFREGNVIHLAQVSLGVAEACSGLRSLGSLLVMGLLIGFIQYKHVLPRVVLVALAIPISIAVNVIRVSGTAIVADYDFRIAMGFYHSFSGWLVFVTGMVFMFAAAKLIHSWIDMRL